MRQPCQRDSAVPGPFLRAAYPSAKREQYAHKLMLFQRHAFPDIFDLFECFRAADRGCGSATTRAQHAHDPAEGVPPVLVRDDADRGPQGRAQAVHPARREDRAVARRERRAGRLQDRCCHRTAKLSKGWCDNGHLVCGYHGWTYDRDGTLVRIPQFSPEQVVPRLGVRPYHCAERYGYAWVCLEEPLAPIPDVPEDREPGFRRIQQFHEVWNTAPLRLMENSFDNAHFAFVHKGTFGQISQPQAGEIRDQRDRLRLRGGDHRHHRQPADGVPHHRHHRARDQAPHAQQVVHAVLPPARHRISVRPAPHHLQLRDAGRRRLDQGRADPLSQRHRRRTAPPRS